MTQQEATKRFNDLPKEHRITIIAHEIDHELGYIYRQKLAAQKAYRAEMKRLNDRIKFLEERLKRLD